MKTFEDFLAEDWKPGEHFKHGESTYGTVTRVGKRDVHFKHEGSGHEDKFNTNHDSNARYHSRQKIEVTPAEHKSNLEASKKEVETKGLKPVHRWGDHADSFHDGHRIVARTNHATGKLEPHGEHEADHEAHTETKKTSTSSEARDLQKRHTEAAELHKGLQYKSDEKAVEEHHKGLGQAHEAKAKEYGQQAVKHHMAEEAGKGVHHMDHAVNNGHGGSAWNSEQEETTKAHRAAADFHKSEAEKHPDRAEHHHDMAKKHDDRADAHEAYQQANHALEHAKKHLEGHLKKDYWSR